MLFRSLYEHFPKHREAQGDKSLFGALRIPSKAVLYKFYAKFYKKSLLNVEFLIAMCYN